MTRTVDLIVKNGTVVTSSATFAGTSPSTTGSSWPSLRRGSSGEIDDWHVYQEPEHGNAAKRCKDRVKVDERDGNRCNLDYANEHCCPSPQHYSLRRAPRLPSTSPC